VIAALLVAGVIVAEVFVHRDLFVTQRSQAESEANHP
jgi:hypothetical protein